MNNSMNHTISNEKDVQQIVFTQWPMDMDDEEFRAGYPYTSTELETVTGSIFFITQT